MMSSQRNRQLGVPLRRLLRFAAAAALTLPALAASAEEPWQPAASADREGVTLEKRAVPGSKYYEYRASATTGAPVDAVLHGIWTGVIEQLPPTVKQRKVLSQGPTELVFYDQIKTKVVSDRDYTLRMSWARNKDTGVVEVPFDTQNQLGPPPASGHVRVPVIHGDWILTPLPAAPGSKEPQNATSAGTKVTYVCYSEPGGSIPAFMARGAQQAQVLMDIHRILDRAASAKAAPASP